ncbi:MAG TPA: VCBS repeat-containing protein [Nannocystis sp.]
MAERGNERGSVLVVVGLVTAGAACTTDPPSVATDGSTAAETTDASSGTTAEPTSGTTSTTAPTTGRPNGQCQSNSDCISPCGFCYYGTCFEFECPPECYDDRNCGVGEICEDDECVPIAKIPTCDRQTLTLSAIPLQDAPAGLALADLDGDDVLDLVVAEPAGGVVEILPGDGAGGFAAGTLVETGLVDLDQHVAVADLDLDGDLDLVVLQSAPTGQLSLIFGQDAMYTTPVTFTTAPAPRQVFVGPVDDDATPDIVVVDDYDSIALHLGDGMGGLVGPFNTHTGHGLGAAGVGDLDGDGRLELLAPMTAGDVLLRQYVHGPGGFAAGAAARGIGTSPYTAALIADLLAGPTLVGTRRVSGVGNISLWPADAQSGALPTIDVAIPGGAFVVTDADFDGDGRRDLLLLKDLSGFDLRVLYFDADGPECVQSYTLDHWATFGRIAVADVDSDGRPDVVVADAAGARVSVLRSGP